MSEDHDDKVSNERSSLLEWRFYRMGLLEVKPRGFRRMAAPGAFVADLAKLGDPRGDMRWAEIRPNMILSDEEYWAAKRRYDDLNFPHMPVEGEFEHPDDLARWTEDEIAEVFASVPAFQEPGDVPTMPAPMASAPKAGWTLLAVVCHGDDLERAAGDLEQRFGRYVLERGKRAALIWFWAEITRTALSRAWPAVERLLKLAEFFGKFSGG